MPPTLERTRIIVFAIKAGGSAKTSSCTALAAELGLRGYRVLVVDLDSQSNATTHLGCRDFAEGQKCIIDVMDQKAELREVIVPARYLLDPSVLDMDEEELKEKKLTRDKAYHPVPNVDIAPCDIYHESNDDTETILGLRENAAFWLQDELSDVRDEYDVILIDCPGSYGRVTVSAFVTLDDQVDGEVLPAVLCTTKEAEALDILDRKLKAVREDRTYRRRRIAPTVKKLLVCGAPTASHGYAEDRTTLAEYLDDYGDRMLPPVSFSGHVRSVHRNQTALPILYPKGRGAEDYRKVATELGFPRLQSDS
ncbi:ParA family protein [Streptomyces xiamenensis]|uniref:ParA family protein n=1 Tax=Streptomyces xiamenensis TaxID=408015 RepID=UPI0035DFCD8E